MARLAVLEIAPTHLFTHLRTCNHLLQSRRICLTHSTAHLIYIIRLLPLDRLTSSPFTNLFAF